MGLTANVLQVVGLVLVAIALWIVTPVLGLLAAGVFCVIVGVALEGVPSNDDTDTR